MSYFSDQKRFLEAIFLVYTKNPSNVFCDSGQRYVFSGNRFGTRVHYFGRTVDQKPADSKILVVISGTHGVEAPVGSTVQSMLLETGFHNRLPKDVGLLLIHSLNPYGHVHGRRTDENNIDVNRAGGPEFKTRTEYGKYASLVHPKTWNDDSAEALATILQSDKKFASIIVGGQHDFPDGLCYGGKSGECWSIGVLERICREFLSEAEALAVIDIHTGAPVPYAKGEIFSVPGANDAVREKIARWYGLEADYLDEGLYQGLKGTMLDAMMRFLPKTFVVPAIMEIGTKIQFPESLIRLAAENWIHHHPGVLPEEKETLIRAEFQELFSPDDDFWRGGAWSRCANMCFAAAKGLNEW